MKRKAKEIVSVLIAFVFMASILASCTKQADNGAPASSSPAASADNSAVQSTDDSSAQSTDNNAAQSMDNSAAQSTDNSSAASVVNTVDTSILLPDSSDLPDWTGKQLSISLWQAHGDGGSPLISSKNDVVGQEIARVTGVTIDASSSFDNGGNSPENMLAKMVATGDYPTIGMNLTGDHLQELAQQGIIYDLTGLIQQYCPDLLAGQPKDRLPNYWQDPIVTGGTPGKVFGLPMGYQPTWLPSVYPDQDFSKMLEPKTEYPFFYMRDDIVKMLYPNAKSQDEIDAMYAQNGGFTRDQIFDIPMSSPDDFKSLLGKIQALNLTENGQPVQPTFVYNGGDNWALIACLSAGMNGRNAGWGPDGNDYTFFDRANQTIKFNYQTDEFKNEMLYWNNLVRTGLASKESLVDNSDAFSQKLNSGQYAVSYAWLQPDPAALTAAGKTYRYRKVYMDIPQDTTNYTFTTDGASNGMNVYCIFKDAVSEQDLPQLLQYLNYFWTDQGKRVVNWGPRSAGLFTESNGVRQYADQDIANEIVYGATPSQGQSAFERYGLSFPTTGNYLQLRPLVPNNLDPKLEYPDEPTASMGFQHFSPGYIEPYNDKLILSISALWTNFQGANIPGIQTLSNSKAEEQMAETALLGAADDASFEQLWNTYVQTCQECGMTDDTLTQMNDYYKNVLNKDYMQNLAPGK